MKDLEGKVAVITGAGSGIGRALALKLAEEGCETALGDVDLKALQETAGLINGRIKASTHVCDVADCDQVTKFANEVMRIHGRVDILINNASVIISDTLEDIRYSDFQWVMQINFWGVVHNVKTFLPLLKQRPEAHILNVSSVDGLCATPNNGPYCAAKFAVTGLTETLFQELRGSSVRVSCVLPGGVRTNIHRNGRFFKSANPDMCREDTIECFDKIAPLSPERAAEIIVKGVKKNKMRIIVGHDARLIDFCKRLMPERTTRLAGHMAKKLHISKIGRFPWWLKG